MSHEVITGGEIWPRVLDLLEGAGWSVTYAMDVPLQAMRVVRMERLVPRPCKFCGGQVERCKPTHVGSSTGPPNACVPRAFWAEVDAENSTVLVHRQSCADCYADLEDDYVVYDETTFVCVDCEMKRKGCAAG